ncbi:MAG: DUF5809 family protein [Halodesulfurarchaeum sp.]
METHGEWSPETELAVRERYGSLARPAETVTKSIAKTATDTDLAYGSLTAGEVIEAAQQALFAALLEVTVSTTEEFLDWLATAGNPRVELAGPETVDRRAFHHVHPQGVVTAVSFQDKPDAAIATVRRQAFGRHYRPLLDT